MVFAKYREYAFSIKDENYQFELLRNIKYAASKRHTLCDMNALIR